MFARVCLGWVLRFAVGFKIWCFVSSGDICLFWCYRVAACSVDRYFAVWVSFCYLFWGYYVSRLC